MFDRPKNSAPEPYASAALWLLYHVALFIRNHKLPEVQVADLADAVHNVPQSLTEYGYYFDEATIRETYLVAYDAKWARSTDDFSLIRTLDAGKAQASEWLNQKGQ